MTTNDSLLNMLLIYKTYYVYYLSLFYNNKKMALLNTDTNEYLVVEYVDINYIQVRRHKDKEQRERYKNNTLWKYEQTISHTIQVTPNRNNPVDIEKTLIDNIITSWYETLKDLEEFKFYKNI